MLAWLVPRETAAISAQVLCTPYNHAPCHFLQSHTRKVYACLAVTWHLHFWQHDWDLLHATAVTQGWNGYRNKSQHSTVELNIHKDCIWSIKVLGTGGGEGGGHQVPMDNLFQRSYLQKLKRLPATARTVVVKEVGMKYKTTCVLAYSTTCSFNSCEEQFHKESGQPAVETWGKRQLTLYGSPAQPEYVFWPFLGSHYFVNLCRALKLTYICNMCCGCPHTHGFYLGISHFRCMYLTYVVNVPTCILFFIGVSK